jgi:hypothetical protein
MWHNLQKSNLIPISSTMVGGRLEIGCIESRRSAFESFEYNHAIGQRSPVANVLAIRTLLSF